MQESLLHLHLDVYHLNLLYSVKPLVMVMVTISYHLKVFKQYR